MFRLNVGRLLRDSDEYTRRKETPFSPTEVTLAQIHAAVPKHLHDKSTWRSLSYVARDIAFAVIAWQLARRIDPVFRHLALCSESQIFALLSVMVRCSVWIVYWCCQGVIFTGCWCLAHEAGHGTLSDHQWINHVIGFFLHTVLLVPYYSWRSTHRAHHKATASMERDENYIPRTRSELGLLPAIDYHEIFEETPMYTLLRMLAMQVFGLHTYLFTNILGSPRHPKGANHFKPDGGLFKANERRSIIISDLGLVIMLVLIKLVIGYVGIMNFFKLFLVPWLSQMTNHWIVMLTFLHHSDPTVPYYRGKEWTFLRGAISTVDRPLLGWAGRFFFHNISHDHISHHLFSSIPFYNLPQVTKHVKAVLKDDYNFDSTNTFRALYRTFTECCFVEDEGDIVFYKNWEGKAARSLRSTPEGGSQEAKSK